MTQLFVPLAAPDTPLELDQATQATPTLSHAVPWTTIPLAEVETLVLAGDKIVNVGGVVSGPDVGFVGVGAGAGTWLRIIVRLRVT